MKRSELVKLYSEVPIGGSEEETKQRVKSLFKKSKERYADLSNSDIEYLDMMNDMQEAMNVF